MKVIKFFSFVGLIIYSLFSFSLAAQEEWVIPDKYLKMNNPTDPSVDLDIGKSLYAKHCQSCHGKKGLGDGKKADDVDGDLGDFSSEEFHQQSEGVLFYKSYIGRDDMPNYEKKIPDEEDMWLVVNYIRTLKK